MWWQSRGKTRDDDVVIIDAAKLVDIMVCGLLWETVVFFVQHLHGGDLLYLEWADPAYSVGFVVQPSWRHLGQASVGSSVESSVGQSFGRAGL